MLGRHSASVVFSTSFPNLFIEYPTGILPQLQRSPRELMPVRLEVLPASKSWYGQEKMDAKNTCDGRRTDLSYLDYQGANGIQDTNSMKRVHDQRSKGTPKLADWCFLWPLPSSLSHCVLRCKRKCSVSIVINICVILTLRVSCNQMICELSIWPSRKMQIL